MKNTFKNLLSVILCAVLLFTTVSTAFAADEYERFTEGLFTYRAKDGEAEIMKCDTSASGDIVIPATANGYPVTYVCVEAFKDCSLITSITVGENISYFRFNPFPGCSSLERFIVDEKNIHYTTDEYGVLYTHNMKGLVAYPGASKMENYVIPDGVEHLHAVFDCCANLKTLTVPESADYRENCKFKNCPNLTDVYVGDIKRSWELMNGGDWDFEEGVTVHCREETTLEKLEFKFNSFLNSIAPFLFFGFYFIVGLPALPIALPIVILQMFGVDLPFMKV